MSDMDDWFPKAERWLITIRDAVVIPDGTVGYITASNERHTIAGRRPLRDFNQPMATLVKTGNSRMMRGGTIESITSGEISRFGSFPDQYKWNGEVAERVGNSVPPLFMRSIARNIKSMLQTGQPHRQQARTGKVNYPAILAEAWQQHLAPRSANAPTVISTFAGCGGSSLGYSMAGYKELLAVEWDDNAVATFKLNFPDVPVYHGDIAKLSVEDVLQRTGLQAGELDVFDGSPPCQGFSTAGKRDFDDDRNQLFREYVRLLRGLKPKVFVMENVSGMVKGKMKLIFAEILRELKASGYKVSARLLNAMYFNVPQSRQRMIFIGVREDLGIEPSHPKAEAAPINAGSIKQVSVPCLAHSERVANMWHRLRIGQSGDELPGSKGNSFGLQKIDPSKPCPTILKGWTAGTGLLHWNECRFLSIPEIAQLGSFGLNFSFPGNPSDCVQRIGNSVPPLMMRSVANHIRQHILSKG